jgi:hypothetical protein
MPGYGYPTVNGGQEGPAALTLLDMAGGMSFEVYRAPSDRHETFLSHACFSIDGRSLAFFERTPERSGLLRTAVRCLDVDSGSFRTVPIHDASHYAWLTDTELILYCRPAEKDPWQYAVADLEEGTVRPIPWLKGLTDGHPGTCRAHEVIVSDSYPNRQRIQRLMLFDPSTETVTELARLRIPMRFRGGFRCDFHPRWSPDGSAVCFDSSHTGTRSLCFLRV